jgi:hypothetical protein
MTLQEWLASLTNGKQDAAVAQIAERRIEIAKFDKTDVLTPGVEGLTPFEVIVIEDNQVVEVRHPIGPDAVPQGGKKKCP